LFSASAITLSLVLLQPAAGDSPGAAPAVEPGGATPAATPATPVRYAGLSLGPEARNPLPIPKTEPPKLMWTGFSGAGGAGGEIFLQTTRPVVHDMNLASGAGGRATLSVVLRNCRIHWRNNARRIDTSFFATPVDGIVAKQKRRDVEILVALKESVRPEVRATTGADGTQILVLSFPAERKVAADGTAPAPVAPALPASPPALGGR
jgi:hypothetical protein